MTDPKPYPRRLSLAETKRRLDKMEVSGMAVEWDPGLLNANIAAFGSIDAFAQSTTGESECVDNFPPN